MAESQETRVTRLLKQIASANKVFDAWKDKFHLDRLENYYEGFQWSGVKEDDAATKYCINLVFAEIETTMPSLLFFKPKISMTVRPGREQALGTTSQAQAKLCEQTVQTFIDDPDVGFAVESGLGLRDTFFRFGVAEVGYTADWIDNPNAGKPVLKDGEDEPVLGTDRQPILQSSKILKPGTKESLYVKWIPARNFRVSLSERNRLETNDWVGYFEHHYVEDLKRNKAYKNTATLKATGTIASSMRTTEEGNDDNEKYHGMVKVWKVWDLRRNVRSVVAEGHPKFLLEDKPFTFLPFACLKFYERLGHFYPLPAVFNWLSPQDEKNEIREQQKVHRRRYNRRYLMRDNTIAPEELEKLESGEDGVYAKHTGAPGEQPLLPVPDAPLDGAVWRDLAAADQDFNQVAGSPSESRGIPQASTATQANIMNTRQQLRETSNRTKVAEWVSQIARLILMTIRESMAEEFWIQRNVDLSAESAPQDIARTALLWERITADKLGDIDLDVSVDLASLSPVTEDMQRALWNQVIALISNPAVAVQLANSDTLLRKTLALYGIKTETEIQEIRKACQALVQQMTAMAQAKQGEAGGGMPGIAPTAGVPGAPGMGGGGGLPAGIPA